jgi:DNA polymerase III delta prime subunit
MCCLSHNILPNVILYGPCGTGKTSFAHAAIRKLKAHAQCLELNASDERKVETIREKVTTFARSKPMSFVQHFQKPTKSTKSKQNTHTQNNLKIESKKKENKEEYHVTPITSNQINKKQTLKYLILDEADQLTLKAQYALIKVIDEWKHTLKVITIANHISKLVPALVSRCVAFRFGPLVFYAMCKRLSQILDLENVHYDSGALQSICYLSGGDMRKALNLVQARQDKTPLTTELVYKMNGSIYPNETIRLINVCVNQSLKDAFEQINENRLQSGYSLRELVSAMGLLIIKEKMFLLNVRLNTIQQLAAIEYALSCGASETLQLYSLLGVLKCTNSK